MWYMWQVWQVCEAAEFMSFCCDTCFTYSLWVTSVLGQIVEILTAKILLQVQSEQKILSISF